MECMVCAENSEYFGLPECEHKEVCSLCWFRLLVQLKTNSCPVCRNVCETIFIISNPNVTYVSLTGNFWGESFQGFAKDSHSGLYFESKYELARLNSFKKLVCKICKFEFRNVNEYKTHVKCVHNKMLCEQCMQSAKLFPAEQEIFEDFELSAHRESLHKRCNVCSNYFYDTNTLVAHIKNVHHFCEYCPFEQRVAYLNFQSLEKHYQEKHFYCSVLSCKESRCFVFKKYEDFQEHYRQMHPGSLAPKPAFGFRIKDDEEKCTFEDNTGKRPATKPPIRDSQDFPPLAPAGGTVKVLDYSKVIKKNLGVKTEYAPERFHKKPQMKHKNPVWEEIKNEVPVGYSNSPPVNHKQDLLEKNIAKLNNGHLSKEELIEFIRKERICVDNDLKKKIREKIWSNSEKEDIVFKLENPNYKKNKESKDDFPTLQTNLWTGSSNELPSDVYVTLGDNLLMLNSSLIGLKDFADNVKQFVPRDMIDKALEIVKGSLVKKDLFETIEQSLKQATRKKIVDKKPDLSNNRFQEPIRELRPKTATLEFPSINSAKTTEIEETLGVNIELYNARVISMNDLVKNCKEFIPSCDKEVAYRVIREKAVNSEEVIEKLEQQYRSKLGFVEISIGREPRAYRRGRRGRR